MHNTIIAVRGVGDTGKTTSVGLAYQTLKGEGSERRPPRPRSYVEVRGAILVIGGVLVARQRRRHCCEFGGRPRPVKERGLRCDRLHYPQLWQNSAVRGAVCFELSAAVSDGLGTKDKGRHRT